MSVYFSNGTYTIGKDPAIVFNSTYKDPSSMFVLQGFINGKYMELIRDWNPSMGNGVTDLTPGSKKGDAVLRGLGSARSAQLSVYDIRYTGGKWQHGGQNRHRDQDATLTINIADCDATKPTASVTVSPMWSPTYIVNHSKIRVQTTASAIAGASISSIQVISSDGVTLYGDDVSFAVTSAGTKTITVNVTDTRGFTRTITQTIEAIAVKDPVLESLTVTRTDAKGNASDSGTCAKIEWSASCDQSTVKDNALSIQLDYMDASGSWAKLTTQAVEKGSYITGSLFPLNDAGKIRLTLSDHYTSLSQVKSVLPPFVLVSGSNDSIAFGKLTKDNGQMEVAMPLTVTNQAYFESGLHGNNAAFNGTVWCNSLYATGGGDFIVRRDFPVSFATPSTAKPFKNNSPLEVDYTVPDGYKLLMIGPCEIDGFTGAAFAQANGDGKLKVWYETATGMNTAYKNTIWVRMLFIRK